MVQLGALFGVDRRTELLFLCVVGIIFAMFDESLLDLNANIQSVWRAEIPRDIMGAVAQQAIKTVLVIVLVVRTYVSYLQLLSYVGVFWPLVFETQRWLITAWLLVSGVQQLVLTVMTAAMGTLVCASVGSARPACVQFTIAQCCRFVPAAYFWYSMYSYYREMGCETSPAGSILSPAIVSTSSEELRASEIKDLRKFETALRRRQVRSMVANSPGYNGSDETFVSDESNADIECDIRLTKSSNDSSRGSVSLSNIPSVSCPRSLDTLFASTSTKSDENCVSGGDSDDTVLDIEEMVNVADKVKKLLNISESDIEAAKCASPIDWSFFSTKRPDLCLQIATHRPLLNSARVSKDLDAEQNATEQTVVPKNKRGLETIVKHSRDKTVKYEEDVGNLSSTKCLTVEDFHENVSSNKTAPEELQIITLASDGINQEQPVISSTLSGPNASSSHDSYTDASLYSSYDGDAVRPNASGVSDFSNLSEFVDTDLKIEPTPKPKKKREPKTETAETLEKIGEGLQNQNESSSGEKPKENKEESKNNDAGNESKTQDCEVSNSEKTLVSEESNMNVVQVDSNMYFIVEKPIDLGIDAIKTDTEKDTSNVDLKKSKSSQISVVNVKSNTYVIKTKTNTPKTANTKIRTSSFRKPAERNKIGGEVVEKTGSGKSIASVEGQKDINLLKKTNKASQNESSKPDVNKNIRSKPSIYVMNCKSKLKGIENKVNLSTRPSINNHTSRLNVAAKPELVIGLKKNVIRASDYQFSSDVRQNNRTEIGIYARDVVKTESKELVRLNLADLQVKRFLPDSPVGSTSKFNSNTFIKNREVGCQASSIYRKFLVNNYDELRSKLDRERRGKKDLSHGFAGKKDFDNVYSRTKRNNL